MPFRKKSFFLYGVLSLALLFFAACSSGNSEGSSRPTPTVIAALPFSKSPTAAITADTETASVTPVPTVTLQKPTATPEAPTNDNSSSSSGSTSGSSSGGSASGPAELTPTHVFIFKVPTSTPLFPATPSFTPTPAAQGTPAAAPAKFDIDAYIKRLDTASIAFNVPTEMELGATYTIHLVLSPNETVPQVVTEVAKTSVDQPQPTNVAQRVEGATVPYDTNMVARLTGSKFNIVASMPDVQAISHTQNTEWIWYVTPQEEGQQVLTLSIYVQIDAENVLTTRVFKTFERTLKVNVSFARRLSIFVTYNWQWLLSAIVFPLVLVAFRWIQSKMGVAKPAYGPGTRMENKNLDTRPKKGTRKTRRS